MASSVSPRAPGIQTWAEGVFIPVCRAGDGGPSRFPARRGRDQDWGLCGSHPCPLPAPHSCPSCGCHRPGRRALRTSESALSLAAILCSTNVPISLMRKLRHGEAKDLTHGPPVRVCESQSTPSDTPPSASSHPCMGGWGLGLVLVPGAEAFRQPLAASSTTCPVTGTPLPRLEPSADGRVAGPRAGRVPSPPPLSLRSRVHLPGSPPWTLLWPAVPLLIGPLQAVFSQVLMSQSHPRCSQKLS